MGMVAAPDPSSAAEDGRAVVSMEDLRRMGGLGAEAACRGTAGCWNCCGGCTGGVRSGWLGAGAGGGGGSLADGCGTAGAEGRGASAAAPSLLSMGSSSHVNVGFAARRGVCLRVRHGLAGCGVPHNVHSRGDGVHDWTLRVYHLSVLTGLHYVLLLLLGLSVRVAEGHAWGVRAWQLTGSKHGGRTGEAPSRLHTVTRV